MVEPIKQQKVGRQSSGNRRWVIMIEDACRQLGSELGGSAIDQRSAGRQSGQRRDRKSKAQGSEHGWKCHHCLTGRLSGGAAVCASNLPLALSQKQQIAGCGIGGQTRTLRRQGLHGYSELPTTALPQPAGCVAASLSVASVAAVAVLSGSTPCLATRRKSPVCRSAASI